MVEKVAAGTRELLLTTAERLLLVEPYDEVSVRGICAAAKVNPAAVHYHFGSKEALVGALIEDRLGPLWAAGLAGATAGRDSVPAVVDTILAPFVELAADPLGRLHLRLLARFVIGRHLTTWRGQWFQMESWTALLPELSTGEGTRRWMLAFDLIIMRFGSPEIEEHGMSAPELATLRDFVVAGLTTPKGTH
ncbi:TetR/AcrR family transcriptional regulator [Nocardia sp. NBC_01503]|uniref:helix-turn-helix domain-containing protein n=1 Tax=Nocardia sp. NBC_01503 TaxID=2975997 RepID=UPI002E7AE610|nr:helix-turn-helix domain-containing protein [Nocardia sp. NBC_01503]WTL31525.1 TetR/AcrR family transcriptional regulator [Nocardia sp. NBC_01503]